MNRKLNAEHPWMHYLLLTFGVLCIAWSAIFVKMANVSGFASGFYRMFYGTLGVLPIWFFMRKPIQSMRGVKVAMLCGTFFAIDIALWNSSIMLSKASISTLLANLSPVWVGLGSLFFLKEKPQRTFWTGTLIAIAGVSVIIGINQLLSTKLNMGNTLAIAASMFYGAYLITVKKGRNSLDTFSFTAISMTTSTVVLGLICLLTWTPISGFSTQSHVALLLLGLVPQLLGWLSINQALGHIKPTVASVILLSQSVFTALFSVPILGETLNVHEIVGAAIVLTGIYLVSYRRN